MILSDFISHKTCYYFLKDSSNLDLTCYKDETSNYQTFIDGGYKAEDFWNIYREVGYSSNNIALIKTNFGTIVFNRCNEHEYVKKFLIRNSKNKPCALFLTNRISETHLVAIAENGELKRYIYFAEDGHVLEGKQTLFEKKNNINLKLDERGCFEKVLNEGLVYDYSLDFMGFNKNDDIEILDFKFYKLEEFVKDVECSDSISNDIIFKINANLENYNLSNISINIVKFEGDKSCYITCSPTIGDKSYYLFNRQVTNIKNKKEFTKLFNMALNVLADCNYKEFTRISLEGYFFYRLFHEFNYDMCSAMIDNDDKGSLCIGLSIKDKKHLSESVIVKKMIDFSRFCPQDVKIIHKYVIKNLKPKKVFKDKK